AVKFTEKGSASLDVEFGAREGNVVRLRFRVTDTGIGMDSAAQARIFERFAQAETSITRRFGGTGLGLAISRNLLKLMGSELLLQSSVGVGSCFEFELALGVFQPTRKLPVIKTEHKDLEVLGAGKLVLVVEDNPLNLKLSVRLLGGMGFLTEEAQNGKEALDRLSQTEFSLVLMDCQMPVLDGFSATQEIRTWKSSLNTVARSNSVIPIIGVTAEALKGSRESCLEAGMDDYIAKPFKIDQFESVLARWVQG
ncbi:MAG TPA: response regulator, partial [Fibrobacteraceae bacterium]|nr:response regulator [Fibrobacteraceae bacterium]